MSVWIAISGGLGVILLTFAYLSQSEKDALLKVFFLFLSVITMMVEAFTLLSFSKSQVAGVDSFLLSYSYILTSVFVVLAFYVLLYKTFITGLLFKALTMLRQAVQGG